MDALEYIEGLLSFVIPELSDHKHKGQAGRIGVIGGCREFTGAPYYASISSLKIGSDLAYVFCTSDAAIPIKSYSPELIVVPVLDSKDVIATVSQYMPSLHALIIGPGLGRDEALSQTIFSLITKAREFDLPLLLDADSLHFVCKQPDVIKNYAKAILTPNAIEFSRLYNIILNDDLNDQRQCSPEENLKELCSKLGNVTIVRKGRHDLISDGKMLISCDQYGSNRRCGGQGDLLVGSMATFAFWSHANKQMEGSVLNTSWFNGAQLNPCIIAAYAACLFTRKCNKLAFEQLGRTMTTTDMIKFIPNAFEALFPKKFKT